METNQDGDEEFLFSEYKISVWESEKVPTVHNKVYNANALKTSILQS